MEINEAKTLHFEFFCSFRIPMHYYINKFKQLAGSFENYFEIFIKDATASRSPQKNIVQSN